MRDKAMKPACFVTVLSLLRSIQTIATKEDLSHNSWRLKETTKREARRKWTSLKQRKISLRCLPFIKLQAVVICGAKALNWLLTSCTRTRKGKEKRLKREATKFTEVWVHSAQSLWQSKHDKREGTRPSMMMPWGESVLLDYNANLKNLQ